MPVERRQGALRKPIVIRAGMVNAHLAFADPVKGETHTAKAGPTARKVDATLTCIKVPRSRPCNVVSYSLKRHTMNSVHDARWLLGSVFALAIIVTGIGLAVGEGRGCGDVMFLISLFVLGGGFWDKLRALFVRDAYVISPD